MLLYKYYPCNENTYKSLVKRGLWCHYPKNMNDPFECLAQVPRVLDKQKIEAFREYVADKDINTFKYLLGVDDDGVQRYFNMERQKFISKWAFCSLAEKPDDILMWSYYTNGHKGFVIGFEFDDLENDLVFQQVCYRDHLNDFDLIRWADFIAGDNRYLNIFLKDISIKSEVWIREKEWRIWRNEPRYYFYRPHEVKEVYFGINCDEGSKELIAQLLDYLPDDFMYFEMEFRDNPIRLEH